MLLLIIIIFFSNWACQFLLCQLFGHETARDVDHFIMGVPSRWTTLPLMNGWTFLIPMSSSEFELRPYPLPVACATTKRHYLCYTVISFIQKIEK